MPCCLRQFLGRVCSARRFANHRVAETRADFCPTTFDDAGSGFTVLIIAAPLILESQGFYNRPVLGPRGDISGRCSKAARHHDHRPGAGDVLFRFVTPRGMMTFFGVISFSWSARKNWCGWRSKQTGAVANTNAASSSSARKKKSPGCARNWNRKDESVAVIAQFNLIEPRAATRQMLHDHSAYGVILSAKHTYFEQVETSSRPANSKASRSGSSPIFSARRFPARASTNCSDARCSFSAPRPKPPGRGWSSSSWISLARWFCCWWPSPLFLIDCRHQAHFARPGFFRQQRSG
jgi:hypothetical protein